MSFGGDTDTFLGLHKLEERDDAARHELRPDRPAVESGKVLSAQSEILLDLHHAHPVLSPLGLHREHVMRAVAVEADIDFVGFDLPEPFDPAPEMTLQRVSRQAGEDIDEAVERALAKLLGLKIERIEHRALGDLDELCAEQTFHM